MIKATHKSPKNNLEIHSNVQKAQKVQNLKLKMEVFITKFLNENLRFVSLCIKGQKGVEIMSKSK